jgi:hypothetical protein
MKKGQAKAPLSLAPRAEASQEQVPAVDAQDESLAQLGIPMRERGVYFERSTAAGRLIVYAVNAVGERIAEVICVRGVSAEAAVSRMNELLWALDPVAASDRCMELVR